MHRQRIIRAALVLIGLIVVVSGRVGGAAASAATAPPDPVALFGLSDPGGRAHTVSKPIAEAPFPYLPDEPEGRSFSVGTVSDGYVVNAVNLPLPGRTYAVLPRQRRRDLSWGTQETIAVIVDASERVERGFPGSILWLGNIGARGGGDIPYSVSHNAGRDADLAFYSLDPSGHPVAPPDMLHFDGSGRSREYGGFYRFDVPRNWALVRALLQTPYGELQYLFISNPLRALLLAHAERIGEPPELIAIARRVLYQPGPEIPHDDHLHLRYHCARADLAAGCVESGPPPRTPVDGAAIRAARIAQAASLLRHGEPQTRARAVDRLALLDAGDQLDAIRGRFSDPSAWVRARAVAAIGRLGGPVHVSWLAQLWEEESDAVVREQILRATAMLGGPAAAELVARALGQPLPGRVLGKVYDLRMVAVVSARELATSSLVESLVALLADEDRELAAAAHAALRELANVDVDGFELRGLERPTQAVPAAWSRWWADAAMQDRGEWLDAGFVAAGYDLSGSAHDVAAELARAAGDPRPWIRRNAQRELQRMTGNPARSLEWSRQDATAYWTRWVRRNPRRVASR